MQHSTFIHYGPVSGAPFGEMDFLIPQQERYRGEDYGGRPMPQAITAGQITQEAWLQNPIVQAMLGAEGTTYIQKYTADHHKTSPDFMQSAVDEAYGNITDVRRRGAVVIAGVATHGQLPTTGQELRNDILVFPGHRVVGFSNVSLKFPPHGITHSGMLGALRRSPPPGSYNALTHVNVLPRHQRKGIGAALVYCALSQQRADLPSVTHVLEADAGLIGNLEACGYAVDAKVTDVPAFGLFKPVDFVRLRAESTGDVCSRLVAEYAWLQNADVTTESELRF